MSTSTTDTALAPFGWYPDPAGSAMLRWWDGSSWTDKLEMPRPEVQPAYGYSTRELRSSSRHSY
ncbi:MAG: DUF2510 domain-containing protein [Salinibacterium sp.]|nr:MAG: DUF2510 domain-containing protein [Salinibacterium sp.]